MNGYVLSADAVALAHTAYVIFVVAGFALIVAGIIRRWRWVRDWHFRLAHLAAIVAVCAESLTGIACPLTQLESRLRMSGGESESARDFVGYWIDRLIYYHFPPWVFTLAYAAFALMVAATFVLAPPRRSRPTAIVSSRAET
jgi:uncharacterized protein DUF2784